MLIIADTTTISPPTNSSIFINLSGFRTLGDYDFVDVAKANNSTDATVAEKKQQLQNTYFNQVTSN